MILVCIFPLRTTDPNSWAFLKKATDYLERGGQGGESREELTNTCRAPSINLDRHGVVEREIQEVQFTSLKV